VTFGVTHFVNSSYLMRDRWYDMARHGANNASPALAVLTDFVSLKWHDLARHTAGQSGNKIHASVRLALLCTLLAKMFNH